VGSAVERAYRRGDLLDQRRRLMENWARYCAEGRPSVTIKECEFVDGYA